MLHQNKSSMVTYLFSAYFIPVYVSFIIIKNCGFDTTIFNVKTWKLNGIFLN